jgi:hypothetical protein
MVRKHGTGPLEAEPLFGLVRLTADRRPEYEVPPTPIHVFQCHQCGFIALFSEDLETDWKVSGQLYADEAERFLTEKRSKPPEPEGEAQQ